jgi:hypothetical protein
MMVNDFIPYDQALALRVQGFDEPCLAWYEVGGSGLRPNATKVTLGTVHTNSNSDMVQAPLYQQAFRWFRDRDLYHEIQVDTTTYIKFSYRIVNSLGAMIISEYLYKSYEEAELECLKYLISYG